MRVFTELDSVSIISLVYVIKILNEKSKLDCKYLKSFCIRYFAKGWHKTTLPRASQVCWLVLLEGSERWKALGCQGEEARHQLQVQCLGDVFLPVTKQVGEF